MSMKNLKDLGLVAAHPEDLETFKGQDLYPFSTVCRLLRINTAYENWARIPAEFRGRSAQPTRAVVTIEGVAFLALMSQISKARSFSTEVGKLIRSQMDLETTMSVVLGQNHTTDADVPPPVPLPHTSRLKLFRSQLPKGVEAQAFATEWGLTLKQVFNMVAYLRNKHGRGYVVSRKSDTQDLTYYLGTADPGLDPEPESDLDSDSDD